jgi:L-threonylcarbamoyladenylate synthase
MAQISTSSRDAASLLNQNEIVAIPTETVYGLAGMPTVKSLKDFRIKKRPFIIHLLFISNRR